MRYTLALTQIDSRGRIRRNIILSPRARVSQIVQAVLLALLICAASIQGGWQIGGLLSQIIH